MNRILWVKKFLSNQFFILWTALMNNTLHNCLCLPMWSTRLGAQLLWTTNWEHMYSIVYTKQLRICYFLITFTNNTWCIVCRLSQIILLWTKGILFRAIYMLITLIHGNFNYRTNFAAFKCLAASNPHWKLKHKMILLCYYNPLGYIFFIDLIPTILNKLR